MLFSVPDDLRIDIDPDAPVELTAAMHGAVVSELGRRLARAAVNQRPDDTMHDVRLPPGDRDSAAATGPRPQAIVEEALRQLLALDRRGSAGPRPSPRRSACSSSARLRTDGTTDEAGRGRNVLVANRRFRRLWLARAISFIGDGIALTALVLHVETAEGTGTAVAALLLAQALPHLLGPVAGTFADRVDQRTLMIGCDLARAAVFAATALILPGHGRRGRRHGAWHRPSTRSSGLRAAAPSPRSSIATTSSARTHGWGPR